MRSQQLAPAQRELPGAVASGRRVPIAARIQARCGHRAGELAARAQITVAAGAPA